MTTFYKVRSKTDPTKYHTGGLTRGRWARTGKVWYSIGSLRSFLTMHIDGQSRQLDDFEIVEYYVEEVSTKPVHEVVKPEKLVKLLTKK